MKVAILLTNNDTEPFAQAFPNDGQKVAMWLRTCRPQWQYDVFAVKDGVFPSYAKCDAAVITGSPASVNDENLAWVPTLLNWIVQAHQRQLPLIGLCFGHQAIAKALGGKVERHRAGWGLGLVATQWQSDAASSNWMQPAQADLSLFAAHNEHVTELPAFAKRVGANSHCPNAAFTIGMHILTTQYHPEMPRPFMLALLEFLSDKLNVSTIAKARESLSPRGMDQPDDAATMAKWACQFLEQAQEARP